MKIFKKFIRSKAGFTLLEVMVALTILGIGLLGLALFQTTAIKANKSGNEFAQASFIAQQRVEAFRVASFDTITTSTGIQGGQPDTSSFPTLPSTQTNTSQGVNYFSLWNITDLSTDLKEISLWVYWQDKVGILHNVLLMARHGR